MFSGVSCCPLAAAQSPASTASHDTQDSSFSPWASAAHERLPSSYASLTTLSPIELGRLLTSSRSVYSKWNSRFHSESLCSPQPFHHLILPVAQATDTVAYVFSPPHLAEAARGVGSLPVTSQHTCWAAHSSPGLCVQLVPQLCL